MLQIVTVHQAGVEPATSQSPVRCATATLQSHTYLRKKTVKIVFPQVCQMFTKFDNFWHEDGQDNEIMQGALGFHLI